MEFDGGWDSRAVLVDGWVERRPRRPEVGAQLRREARLMPWLAPRLPLPVPVPGVVSEEPLILRHRFVPGAELTEPTANHGRALGEFLRALHDVPANDALRHGLPPEAHTRTGRAADIDRFRTEVVPLLPAAQRDSALSLLDAAVVLPADTVVHGDLGPEHVLAENGTLSGIIDFSDAHLGDPAIDLAWALFGTPPEFGDAVTRTYGVTVQLRARAQIWHRLGPWHEVIHGLDIDGAAVVEDGLAGVLTRLS
ncbi:phosphotransferase [Nocardia sp. NPDC056100]|uniref:phosphotransferase n=1 Tax=Nocardia sp. NPDC056100 TaxID=3345712 RepID=UPI0035DB8FE0